MKKNSFFLIFFFLLFNATPVAVFAQQVDIDYTTRFRNVYSVTIFFSGPAGQQEVSADDFRDQENIFFTISVNPNSQRDHFRMSDLTEEFSQIHLVQNGQTISRSTGLQALDLFNERFTKVLMTYSKDDLLLYKPFFFTSPLGRSEEIKLDEVFYLKFADYKEHLNQANSFLQEKRYIDAFEQLLPVALDAKSEEEIRHYSFFEEASETRIEEAIELYIDSIASYFQHSKQIFLQSMDDLSLLNYLDTIADQFADSYAIFSPYLNADYRKSNYLDEKFKNQEVQFQNSISESREIFKNKHFAFFKNRNYEDFKFRLFIDIISKLIVYTDSYTLEVSLQPIDIDVLDYYESEKSLLQRTNWMDDFVILVALLNEEITENQTLFTSDIIQHLNQIRDQQAEPYYEIFLAFNNMSSNPGNFQYYINQAISRSSDETTIKHLERWTFFSRFLSQNIDVSIINNLNKGLSQIEDNQWREATETFEIISMQANHLASPWYYSAIIDVNMGEDFTAEVKFNHAIDRYPDYLSPRLYLFNWLYEKQMYQDIIDQASQVLAQQEVYIIQLWKARALLAQEEYELALEQIIEYAHELNALDVKSWFLLGDIYLAMGNKELARGSYRKTQQIDPFTSSNLYNEKMQAVFDD